jgi:SRSO17 transposase
VARWGLPAEAIEELGWHLRAFWGLYRRWMRTTTRDTSEYGYEYLSGLLRMEEKRTIANIGRQTGVPEQNMQHFISQSPWPGQDLIAALQGEIALRGEVSEGAMLLLDESAEEKAGEWSVGAGRQYNGRRGKVDNSQVGVFLTLAKGTFWTWVDGEVFLPEDWFSTAYAEQRRRVGVPTDRVFQTKIELGWQMIQRARANGLPFEAVACDTLYGRNNWLRSQMNAAGIEYYADVPVNTPLYLSPPAIGRPTTPTGRTAKQPRVLTPQALRVDDLRDHPDTLWQTIELRPCERGFLVADFARIPVWTVDTNLNVRHETLLIRRDPSGRCTYSLTNAPAGTPLPTLACRKSQRYFVERSIQDAKSDLGWDEFQATKFLAWQHHLALTILAAWFVAETKLDWAIDHQRDPTLLADYEIDILPALSMSNVRTLLRAALPLPQLSIADATALVVKHLDNRTRSRKSRLKRRTTHLGP